MRTHLTFGIKDWDTSHERMVRLVKDELLSNLDFTDFGVCIDCIKGKQAKTIKKTATRSSELLELIHTDICGKIHIPCFTGEAYFTPSLMTTHVMVTFI